MNNGLMIIVAIAGLVVGGLVGVFLNRKSFAAKQKNAEQDAAQIVANAKKEAETLCKEAEVQAKDAAFRAKEELEAEARETRRELQAQEKRLIQKEENLDRNSDHLEE